MGSARVKRGSVVVIVVVLSVWSIASGGQEMVSVGLELPAERFLATPPNLSGIANLEKFVKGKKPVFYAPGDVRNVALGKPIASSDDTPIIGELEMVTDGDKEGVDGSFVELGPFVQHVQIDLEGEHEIYAVAVWHWHCQARVYYDVAVQVADDADFTENVRTLFNNDMDNSAGLGVGGDMHYVESNAGKLIDAKGERARYVRLYSNGYQEGDLNAYTEVEVWGREVRDKKVECKELVIEYPEPAFLGESWHLQRYTDFSWRDSYYMRFMVPVGTRNLALGKKVTASSPDGPLIGDLEMITDDNKKGNDMSMVETWMGLEYVTVDLGDVYELYGICVWRDHNHFNVYEDVIVQIARDAGFVETVTLFNNDRDNSAGLGAGADRAYLETNRGKMISAAGLRGRYVRVWSNGCRSNDMNRYVEISVYGKEYDPGAGDDRLIPLNFEFPVPRRAMRRCTIAPPNTEELSEKERETFCAPVGTINMSLGKPVSGSDAMPIIGKLEMVTDGNKDGTERSYVELGPFVQHIQIDLERECEISAILVWHYLYSECLRVYFDVVVQVSNDASFTEGVHVLFNNDIDGSSGLGTGEDMRYFETVEGKLVDAGGIRGRYVRLYSNGNTANDLNNYVEVEVYGR